MEIPGIGRPLKRTRITRACEQCRARKVKCNGDEPCITCWQHNQACTYRSSAGTASQARSLPQSAPSTGPDRHAESALETGKKPSPARYNPDEYRQQLELRAGIGVSNSQTGSFQFYGPSSHFCFIQRIYQRMKRQTNMTLLGQQKTAVPDGLEQWGLERFMFAAGSDTLHMRSGSTEAFLSKENGHRFINAYFSIIHPHMPILSKRVIAPLWDQFWDAPTPGRDVKSKDVVYMVLALGARAIPREEVYSIEFLDKWADHFWAHSNNFSILFQEPSVKGTHLLLLKAMFALHGMRPNDAYLYLGHAARSVLALGINRSQVANGSGEAMHRLRVTFWVVYYYE